MVKYFPAIRVTCKKVTREILYNYFYFITDSEMGDLEGVMNTEKQNTNKLHIQLLEF